MSISDEVDRDVMMCGYEEEMRVGLLFPNWGPCKYRGNGCPLEMQEKREDGLLMGYCSNNYSIRSCLVYRVLEWCKESL